MLSTIDFGALIDRTLPSYLRRPVLMAILRAACVALDDIQQRFALQRERKLERLMHNGQVCHLRALLGKYYPGIELRASYRVSRPIYAEREDDPRLLLSDTEPSGRPPIAEDETGRAENLFVILIPALLYDNSLEQIRALVDKYKLVSKRVIYQRK